MVFVMMEKFVADRVVGANPDPRLCKKIPLVDDIQLNSQEPYGLKLLNVVEVLAKEWEAAYGFFLRCESSHWNRLRPSSERK